MINDYHIRRPESPPAFYHDLIYIHRSSFHPRHGLNQPRTHHVPYWGHRIRTNVVVVIVQSRGVDVAYPQRDPIADSVPEHCRMGCCL
jgi:hypothetical protein